LLSVLTFATLNARHKRKLPLIRLAHAMLPNNWRNADPIPRAELVARIQGRAGAVLGRLAKTLAEEHA